MEIINMTALSPRSLLKQPKSSPTACRWAGRPSPKQRKNSMSA